MKILIFFFTLFSSQIILSNETLPPLEWTQKSYATQVLPNEFPMNFCDNNTAENFSMNYKYSLVPKSYRKRMNEAFFSLNWIIYNTDFLDMLRVQKFSGISAQEVAARIKYSKLNISFKFRSFGAMGKSYVCSRSQKIIINKSRVMAGAWPLARTVFHESMHVIGLRHSHGFVDIIGPMLEKYYQDNKKQIQLEFQQQ